jgi:hypothetical protein
MNWKETKSNELVNNLQCDGTEKDGYKMVKILKDGVQVVSDQETGKGFILMEFTTKGNNTEVLTTCEASMPMMMTAVRSLGKDMHDQIAKKLVEMGVPNEFPEFLEKQMQHDVEAGIISEGDRESMREMLLKFQKDS